MSFGFTEKMETPPSQRFQQIHLGHCAFAYRRKDVLSQNLIGATGGLWNSDEIITMLERGYGVE